MISSTILCFISRSFPKRSASLSGLQGLISIQAAKMSSHKDEIENLRKPYNDPSNELKEADLVKNPYKLFEEWFAIAKDHPDINEPNAMTIATVKPNGRPAARMVLLKDFGDAGFTFYTNYRSSKAQDLEANPYAALVFFWEQLNRSVRIEGDVERVPAEVSDAYFSKRPISSQLAAHCSIHQSGPLADKETLNLRWKNLKEQYGEGPVPRPEFWGGYIVRPHTFEFWQGQSTRMHDRIVFSNQSPDDETWLAGDDSWVYRRLEP